MATQTIQLLCFMLAIAISHGMAKKWNTMDPVVKFYCEADYVKNMANDTKSNHVSCLKLLYGCILSNLINAIHTEYNPT